MTTSIVGLIKRLSSTRVRGFPPLAGSNIFNAVIAPSLMYGMVQLDTGPTRARVNGRLVVSHQGRKRGTKGGIPGVEDDPDSVALVVGTSIPRVPVGQVAGAVEVPRRSVAGQPPPAGQTCPTSLPRLIPGNAYHVGWRRLRGMVIFWSTTRGSTTPP
jgi:hypothetical protein